MNIVARQETISPEVLQNLELIEAAAWNEMYKATDKFTKRDCGMQAHSVNGATISITSEIDVLAFNRVVGWGIKQKAREEDLAEIKAIYSKAKVPRFFIQVSPNSVSQEMQGWLQQNGFEFYNNWVKLYMEAGDTPHPATEFKFKEVTSADSKTFATIISEAFQWPETVHDILTSLIGRKDWYNVIAWLDKEAVATASFYRKDEYAWFCFSATAQGFRAQGAQTAMISHLVEKATAAGCKHIFVETSDEKAGNPSPSARNLMRMGFRELYKRPNYIYYNK